MRLLRKSMKCTPTKFVDHATCSVSLLFSEYYFKLYINVNKMVADCVLLYAQSEIRMLWHIKQFLPFSILLIQNFSSRKKVLWSVGLRQTKSYLRIALGYVCLSVLASICPKVFFEFTHQFFLIYSMVS